MASNYAPIARREGDIDLADPNLARDVYSNSPQPSPIQPNFADSAPDLTLGGDLPSGAGAPRFLGQAAYSDNPQIRNSYADSQHTAVGGSEYNSYNSSAYALNSGGYKDDPSAPSRFSNYYPEEDGVQMSNMGADRGGPRVLEEKRAAYGAAGARKSRRGRLILIGIIALILLICAVLIPIYFAVIKPKSDSASGGSADGDSDSDDSSSGSKGGDGVKGFTLATSGGDGSNVYLEDGTSFKYTNSFGGTWYYDMNDPFNNNAQAQSYTPPLNTSFRYGVDRIFGVNVGGWLVTEPFIVPALYERYSNNPEPPIDEWTLMEAMGDEKEKLMEEHYSTFITEKDFADIAAAGLNYVRVPIGWWAIEVWEGEPFVPHLSWKYFLKAVGWARKYGLRINLDIHAMPGSQNGWNHSGRLGTQNMLLGPMGLANAERSLDYIRIVAEFISQDQYKDVITMFGITNEPQGTPIGQDTLGSYYLRAYDIVRTASGFGEGNGPWVSFHDGFFSRQQWAGFLAGADRIQLDDHPYMCFGGQSSDPMSTYATRPCEAWAEPVNTSRSDFGVTAAGEWSLAVTDCGLFLNGVGLGTRYEGDYQGSSERFGSCAEDWTNWEDWDDSLKQDYKNFALASMDALQDFFFWTWRIGDSAASGRVETPHWSYSLGLEHGWMPKDPRESVGYCGNTLPFTGTIAQSSDGQILDSDRNAYPWPPLSINNAGAASTLPRYTPTGTIPTLTGAVPTITGTVSGEAIVQPTVTADVGNGWKNSADNDGAMVPISGCSYLDPWVGPTAAVPAQC